MQLSINLAEEVAVKEGIYKGYAGRNSVVMRGVSAIKYLQYRVKRN